MGGRSRRFESGRPDLVVLLAAGAALSFGALAVTIRLALQPPIDAESASLVTTFLAGVFCTVLAVATGDFAELDWADTWPFFVTGLFAPGISQILFTRGVGVIGPSRTAVLVGVSPVLSAAIAVVVLDEPLHVALVIGTLLVVAGGTMLVRERGDPACSSAIGIALGLSAALLFAIRDNLVRWAARGSDVPGFVAASASLLSATLVIAMVVMLRPDATHASRGRFGPSFSPASSTGSATRVCIPRSTADASPSSRRSSRRSRSGPC